MRSSLLFLVLFSSLVTVLHSTSTVTVTWGVNDNFSTGNGAETVPVSAKARTCSWFDWQGVNGKTGDIKPMEQTIFDSTAYNSPIVIAFTIPAGTIVQNPRFEFNIRATSDDAWNDGIGFLFDDSISKRWGDWGNWGNWGGWGDDHDEDDDDGQTTKTCKIQYFKDFRSFTGATSYGSWGSKANITFSLGDTTLYNSNVKLVDKINSLTTFNVLIGDDSSVDFIRFIYEVGDAEQMVVTSYSCRAYITANYLSPGKSIYAENSTCKVQTLTDSSLFPFSFSTFLRPDSRDARSLQSVFQHRIEVATRYWLFVPASLTLSWINDGLWTALETTAGIVSSDGIKYKVFTKRYEGGRWVVFGPSADNASQNFPMYFIATAPSPTTVTAPVSNPSANCLCSSTGDPHYVTFDSRKYDFYQPGIYHLVKSRDCTFNVQTLTFKYGSTVTVNGIVGIRYLNDTVVLARTKGADGQLWTGSPKVYANGIQITASSTLGGMNITKKSEAEWSINIAKTNFTLRTVQDPNWFHIYASLGDPTYQRTVDGLCGNCDSKGSNDFKFPNCQTAITDTTTANLGASVVAQWGLSWAVATNEIFAANEKLTTASGIGSYAACRAAPLQPICPDLILTQAGGGVEPIPPSSWSSCNGTSVVPVTNVTIPTNPNITTPNPCEGVSDVNKNNYLKRCQECFSLTGYEIKGCYEDFCVAPGSYVNFSCPIPNDDPCPVGVVNVSATWAGYEWATLGAGVEGAPWGFKNFNACLTPFSLPTGWEIAPDGDVSATVAVNSKWEATCVVVEGGHAYPSLLANGGNPCSSGELIHRGNCFVPNHCAHRILIRRPQVQSCGDGVKNATEECDDGNLSNGDGCSQACKIETGWVCSLAGSSSSCWQQDPPINVEGEDPTFTCNLPKEFCSPCPYTPDLKSAKTCCVCNTPCC